MLNVYTRGVIFGHFKTYVAKSAPTSKLQSPSNSVCLWTWRLSLGDLAGRGGIDGVLEAADVAGGGGAR